MNIMNVLYNVPHEIPFHPIFMVMWLFLIPMSAASLIMSVLGLHGVEKFRELAKIGYVTAMAVILIAPFNIILELGHPFRFYQLFINFNPTSPLCWGVVTMSVYVPISAVYGWYLLWKNDEGKAKLWGIVASLPCVAFFLYSGFILAVIEARPMFHSSLMPVLSAVSGFVSALALLLLVQTSGELAKKLAFAYRGTEAKGVAFFGEFLPKMCGTLSEPSTSSLCGTLVQTIILDLMLVGVFVLALAAGSQDAYDTALFLVKGEFSGLFLGIQLLLGAFVPLGLLVFFKRTKILVLVAAILALVGIYAMRYIIIIGGLTLSLT